MRVLVTGGAGFIGANLCRHLLSSGTDQLVVLDDLSSGRRDNLDGLDVDLQQGSVLEVADLERAFSGVEAVVHLAAIPSVPRSVADPWASTEANATGTVRVLEAARRHGGVHVVVASSSSVYGTDPTLPKHEGLPTRPASPYAASKLAAESYALAWQHSLDLPVLAFRFFNVFGPLQPADHAYAAVIPAFVSAALGGEPVTINGDGEQSRDFTYVDTTCAILAEAVHGRITCADPVNLAFGTRHTLLEVLALIEELVGHPVERRHGPPRPGDVRHSQAANDRLLSLVPGIEAVPLRQGLEATIAWHRSAVGVH